MHDDLQRLFIENNSLRLVFAESVENAWSELDSAALLCSPRPHLCGFQWTSIPPLEQMLDELVQLMANVALEIWPNWYGLQVHDELGASSNEAAIDLINTASALKETRTDVLNSWFTSAATMAREGKPPCPTKFNRKLQASQLALAIAPHNLFIVISASENPEGRLLGLVAAAEWLINESGSRVVLLLPLAWEYSPELQRAAYRSLRIVASRSSTSFQRNMDEPKVALIPGNGRPHPNSPGEQLLYKRLALDAELQHLFVFNHTVQMPLGINYRADLLWRSGRVIVEVDGIGEHLNEDAFVRDRERDYRLLTQGYIVLRLPHKQVMEDSELSIEKIRDVVRFRNKYPITWIDT